MGCGYVKPKNISDNSYIRTRRKIADIIKRKYSDKLLIDGWIYITHVTHAYKFLSVELMVEEIMIMYRNLDLDSELGELGEIDETKILEAINEIRKNETRKFINEEQALADQIQM